MRRLLLVTALLFATAASPAEAKVVPVWPTLEWPPILQTTDTLEWHHSRAVGIPSRGRLIKGVILPEQGQDFFTWDWGYNQAPNRQFRRWGTDRLVYTILTVLHQYRVDNPGVARIGIADLSRTRGGAFGKRYGGLGHGSHQNGLDADILYPRLDRTETVATRVSQIDRELAQDLVDRFAEVGAQYVFVGPRTGLRGPRGVVIRLVYHDDHFHLRVR